jgi:hypothetical protein
MVKAKQDQINNSKIINTKTLTTEEGDAASAASFLSHITSKGGKYEA